jgi:hypothetical protein
MRWPLVRFSVRRMLVGVVCGAGLGILLQYAAFGGPQGPIEEANWFVGDLAFASIVAVLGGIAGGVLRASDWAMFAGGIIGAILVGVGGVVATRHIKGLIYSFLDAPSVPSSCSCRRSAVRWRSRRTRRVCRRRQPESGIANWTSEPARNSASTQSFSRRLQSCRLPTFPAGSQRLTSSARTCKNRSTGPPYNARRRRAARSISRRRRPGAKPLAR